MPLRQRLENLPVGQKLLAALLVLLTTVLLVANLTFISAAYYISQESMAPQALQTIGRLISNPSLVAQALESPQSAERLLKELDSYSPLRAAAFQAMPSAAADANADASLTVFIDGPSERPPRARPF